ncbi:signal recognition particle-docking protein FtsY [Mesorhizobium sp. Z1-4]|uniref:signal recognition particle-docking protein FtsY n=1 Tax=Mesorhizobium sp. Z1-4 TaxID=2448478 RepID=UPI000FD9E953|nr:signal recognition particle-docking protein FtsY [Mesorhizobium sp. Z1-4]
MAFGFIKKIFSFGKKEVEEVPAEAETEALTPPSDVAARADAGGVAATPAPTGVPPQPAEVPAPAPVEVPQPEPVELPQPPETPPAPPEPEPQPVQPEPEPEPPAPEVPPPSEPAKPPKPEAKPSADSPSPPQEEAGEAVAEPRSEAKPTKPKAKVSKPKAPTPAAPAKGEDEASVVSDDVTPEDAAALEAAEPWVEPEDDIASSIDARLDEIEQDLAELPDPEIAPSKDSSSPPRGDVGQEKPEPVEAKAQPQPDTAPTSPPAEQVAEPGDAGGSGVSPASKVTVSKSVERAAEAAPAAEPEQPKTSWLQRLRSGLSRSSKELSSSISGVFTKRKLDEDTLQDLEDVLIRADLGAETAMRIADTLSASRYGRDVSDAEVRGVMASEIEKVLSPVAQALELDLSHKPHVILVVGVNGTGKTTTIGKLAAKLVGGGLSVTLAAGDTFRAAAIEQLKIWGERTGSPVVSSKLGADAAGLAWDAFEQAREAGSDVLIIDTAGRLQNRTELMDELEKIVRVLGKHDPEAPHTVLQTVDATTGQNALNQVEIFRNVAGVNGLVMTKLDGTARGGILVAIAAKHKLPVYFIGVGEQVDDLEPFSATDFAAAIAGV